MYVTNSDAWDEVMRTIKKSDDLQAICNELYTDEVRTSFKGLTQEQRERIYEVYYNRLKQ